MPNQGNYEFNPNQTGNRLSSHGPDNCETRCDYPGWRMSKHDRKTVLICDDLLECRIPETMRPNLTDVISIIKTYF